MVCSTCGRGGGGTYEECSRAWERIPQGQHVAKRAIEIALAGGHTLVFLGAWDASVCAAAGRALGVIGCASLKPCLCGNLGDPARACACSTESLLRYRQYYLMPNLEGFQMGVEVGRSVDKRGPGGEPWETVRGRLVRTWDKALRSDVVGTEVDQEGARLLELAMQRMGLNGWEVGNAREIALTIRRMDSGSGGIRSIHVAEAIAYSARRLGAC